MCTGATYLSTSSAVLNCWFKEWGANAVAPPCLPGPENPLEVQAIIDPAGAECSGISYMDAIVYQCDEEPPAAAAMGKYDRFPGRDYDPVTPKSLDVQVTYCWRSYITYCLPHLVLRVELS